ncbi:MAG: hypothetical protein ACTINV_16190, partial [Cellulosimicrobium funkei]
MQIPSLSPRARRLGAALATGALVATALAAAPAVAAPVGPAPSSGPSTTAAVTCDADDGLPDAKISIQL